MAKNRTAQRYVLGVPPPITRQTKGVPYANAETTTWSMPKGKPI